MTAKQLKKREMQKTGQYFSVFLYSIFNILCYNTVYKVIFRHWPKRATAVVSGSEEPENPGIKKREYRRQFK